MAFTRSKKDKLRAGVRKTEWRDDADSTVAQWPASLPKRRRVVDPLERNDGVDWQNGLPEGPLLRIFEILLAEGTDSAKQAMHSAAAACTQWHESFFEVILGDTAASRPERPALPCDDTREKKPPATTATTCAAVCEPSKSETNGFEASSARPQQTTAVGAAATAAAVGTYIGLKRSRSQQTLSPAFAAAATAAAAAAPAAQARHRGQLRRRSRVPRSGQQHEQQLLPPLPELPHIARAHNVAAGAAEPAVGPSAHAGAAWRSPSMTRTGSMFAQQAAAGMAAAAAVPRRQHAPGGRVGSRGAGQQQRHEDHDGEVQQPSAGGPALPRLRHTAAATPASNVTAQPAATTDGDGQQEEVMQPTTAQNVEGKASPATGRRRWSHRVRSSSNAAAAADAAAAALAHTYNRIDEQHHEEPGQQQQAHRQRQRRRTQPHQEQQQQQQQASPTHSLPPPPQQQQHPADSTEAQQLGGVPGGRAAGAARMQGSGSNRQEGWLGNVAHNLAHAINPLHWFRGASS